MAGHKKSMSQETKFSQRLKISAAHLALLGIVIVGLTTHSLDFSANRVTNEFTANGLSSFFEAFRSSRWTGETQCRCHFSKNPLAINM